MYIEEYKGIIVIIIMSIIIGGVIIVISRGIGERGEWNEKGTIYECGYMPYGEIRVPYTIGFIMVGILFMIFDVEVAYLYPWSIV